MKHFCSFSEAIREGAKRLPQGFGSYFLGGASCAFAAGVMAMSDDDPYTLISETLALFPYLRNECDVCPECGRLENATVETTIYHLNDDHKCSREAIADWLEKEEEKLGFVTISVTEDKTPSSIQLVGERVGVTV